ncbi:MAG TPA: indole acetimide hydrolase [Gammaproteobacteria bacterium]|nr:indole acetimide hydrolase [Gammaproteobacteria bacterium]|tara:strand:+ start:142 stop:1527 length:1386 start_codon:yes stop_codon:yes gene_type:complete
MAEDLWKQSATALAELIRTKQTSSEEVVKSHLDRIDAVNGSLNAITLVLADSALATAVEADRQQPTGPLHGVPFTIKENIDCLDSPTTRGVPALAESMPALDAPVVARMKAAGAIPLGRTNLPELGLRITTDNPLHGRTLNPWNADRTAGGSSGGEASALASGMSPLGLGNDIGGSVRNPAFCCGVASLKPSAGRIPHASSIAPEDSRLASQLLLVEGPMARHVKDLRLVYEILSGRDSRDPQSTDAPLYGPAVEKRAAIVTDIPGVELPQATRDAVLEAETALHEMGWETVEIQPPELAHVHEVWMHHLSADFKPLLGDMSAVMSDAPLEFLRLLCERNDPAAVGLANIHAERNRLSRLWSEFFAANPIMVGPTWTGPQFEHDADINGVVGLELAIDLLRFISPANVLGLPSAAIPIGVADGLPTGVQVYADRWRDDLALSGAEAIEAVVGQICPIDPRF